MVWYGMVWCGMVWYGMVWYGMVWYGMVWYGMVWFKFPIRSHSLSCAMTTWYVSVVTAMIDVSLTGSQEDVKNIEVT